MLKQFNARKSIQLDAYQLLKDDIVNYKKLNDYQKMYIEHLTEEQKVEIILLYENVMNSLIESMYTKL
jgi:hypothetical protein